MDLIKQEINYMKSNHWFLLDHIKRYCKKYNDLNLGKNKLPIISAIDIVKLPCPYKKANRSIIIDDKYVTIKWKLYRWKNWAEYNIKLDRIKNEKDLLWWVFHLSQKKWFTIYHAHAFIDKVSKVKNFKTTNP